MKKNPLLPILALLSVIGSSGVTYFTPDIAVMAFGNGGVHPERIVMLVLLAVQLVSVSLLAWSIRRHHDADLRAANRRVAGMPTSC